MNGAIREIGTAFSIALLGTIATRKYQAEFHGSSDIQALRADSGNTFLQKTLDTIGSGAGFGGNVIRAMPGTEQLGNAVATIQRDSGIAFVAGHGARDHHRLSGPDGRQRPLVLPDLG